MMKKIIFLALSILSVGAQDAVGCDDPLLEHADGLDARNRAAYGVSQIRTNPHVSREELLSSGDSVSASSARQHELDEAADIALAEDAIKLYQDLAAKVKTKNRRIAGLFGIGGAGAGVFGARYASKAYPKLEKHRLKLAAAGLFAGCTAGLLASRLCTEKPADVNEQDAAVNKEGMSRPEQACWLLGFIGLASCGYTAYTFAQARQYTPTQTKAATAVGLGVPLLGAGGVLAWKEARKRSEAKHQRMPSDEAAYYKENPAAYNANPHKHS